MRRVFLLVIALLLLIPLAQPVSRTRAAQLDPDPSESLQDTTSIQVDGATRYQTIEGFGVNANSRSWDLGNPVSFTPQIDTLVDDVGATIWRVVVESHEDWEVTNDNADPDTFNTTYYNALYETNKFKKLWAMIDYLEQKDVSTIYLGVMGCLPEWMGRCTLPDDGSMDDEWVEMITSLVNYARNTKHLRIDLLGPLNEEDMPNADSQEGPRMSAERYVTLMTKLSARLDALDMGDLRLAGPDLAGAERATTYLDALASDSDLAAKYDHFSAHRYGSTDFGLTSAIQASDLSRLTPWVSEYSGLCPNFKCDQGIAVTPDEDWAFARDTFDYLLSYLDDGVTAAMVWDGYDSYYEHHETYTYWGLISYDPDTEVYSSTKRLFMVRHTYRFIPAGMQRIDATSANAGIVSMSAFHNSATSKLTLVGRNHMSEPQTMSITLNNVGSPGDLQLYQTTPSVDWSESSVSPDSTKTYTITLAANSMFTLTNVSPEKLTYIPFFRN